MAELKAKVSLNTRAFNVGLARMKRRVSQFAGKVGGQFGAAGANLMRSGRRIGLAAGVALIGASAAAARFGDRMHKMAARTGLGTEALSALSFASQRTGSSIEDVEKAIGRSQLGLKQASDGLTTSTRAYDELGLSVEALMAMSPEDQFMATAKAIADVADESRRAALAQEVFGRGGRKIIPLITSDLEKLTAVAQKLGIILTPDQAEAAAELTDDFLDLKSSLLGVAIAAGTMKPASKLLKEVTASIVRLRESGNIGKFVEAMRSGANQIIATSRGIVGAWQSMDGAQRDALTGMAKGAGLFVGAWVLGFVRPLITITAALVGSMISMLNPAVMLVGLAAVPGSIIALGIGKTLERSLDISSVLVRQKLNFQVLGGALVDSIAAIVGPMLKQVKLAGAALSALMSGEFEKAGQAATDALAFDGGKAMGDGLDQVIADVKENFQIVDGLMAQFSPAPIDPPEFSLVDMFDDIDSEFGKAIAMAEDLAGDLRDKLGGAIVGDEGAEALAAFIAEMKKIKNQQLAINVDAVGAEDAANQLDAAGDALDRLRQATIPFRGGKILDLEVGAQIGAQIDKAQARLDAFHARRAKANAPAPAAPPAPARAPVAVKAPAVIVPDQPPMHVAVKVDTSEIEDFEEMTPFGPIKVTTKVEKPAIDSSDFETALAAIKSTMSSIEDPLIEPKIIQPVISPVLNLDPIKPEIESPIIEPKIKAPPMRPPATQSAGAAARLKSPKAENVEQMRGDFAGMGEALAKIHGTLVASLGVQKSIADKGVIMGWS